VIWLAVTTLAGLGILLILMLYDGRDKR
jgi:hypothetical protein